MPQDTWSAEQLDRLLNRHKPGASSLIPVLQDVQEQYNYLPEQALQRTSDYLQVPLTRVYGVASFFSMFSLEPRGRFHVQLCLGTACHVRGAGGILKNMERELHIPCGSTTDDRLFSLEAVRCLGCCGLAPVAMVNREIYGHLTLQSASELLEQLREDGGNGKLRVR